eukprot:14976050-Alexandrium_andersonii.AAC.1
MSRTYLGLRSSSTERLKRYRIIHCSWVGTPTGSPDHLAKFIVVPRMESLAGHRKGAALLALALATASAFAATIALVLLDSSAEVLDNVLGSDRGLSWPYGFRPRE